MTNGARWLLCLFVSQQKLLPNNQQHAIYATAVFFQNKTRLYEAMIAGRGIVFWASRRPAESNKAEKGVEETGGEKDKHIHSAQEKEKTTVVTKNVVFIRSL